MRPVPLRPPLLMAKVVDALCLTQLLDLLLGPAFE